MASLLKYPGTVSQTTGTAYASWSNLNNVKNNTTGSYAVTATITSKNSSPNRPGTVSCTNFGFSLPTGAEPTKIVIEYRHRKTGSCNIPAPTISLLGVSGFSSKGVAPTTTLTTRTKSFYADGSKNTNLIKATKNVVKRSMVNSSSFGVKIDYPKNTNTSTGTLTISYIRVTVEYKVPSYTLSMRKVSGGYNTEAYVIEASISNKKLTGYNPSLTLSAPSGFSFLSGEGDGSWDNTNARTIVWNPKLTNKRGTSSVRLRFSTDVTYPSGQTTYTGTFTLVESLYSGSKSFTASITNRPPSEQEEVSPTEKWINNEEASIPNPEIHSVQIDEVFHLNCKLDTTNDWVLLAYADPDFALYPDEDENFVENDEVMISFPDNPNDWLWWGTAIQNYISNDGTLNINFKCTQRGQYALIIGYLDHVLIPTKYIKVDCIPDEDDLSTPSYTIMELSTEEINRLGDGYKYIIQSDMKLETSDNFSRDWYKNNRIGVFNNNITNVSDYTSLSDSQIIGNALYWSDETAGLNSYSNVECEFTYDEDYPLYVIVTGDYPETSTYGYDVGNVYFDEPCIIEKAVYNERESNGNYPIPILGLITDDISTINLPVNTDTEPVVLYDIPLNEDYETNDNYAIRGIKVRANLETSANIIVTATLHNPNGTIGQRSIILTGDEEELVIGGLGDLFGFTTLQMTNLDEWELELTTNNILSESTETLILDTVELIFYLETVEEQLITVKVEDEPIAYYGAFVTNIQIPEGLETDTSFLHVDGTDMNDAYRQNIREKKITIEFNISNCDLKTSTDMLRQLTKLFVNEKDEYNRPIPNRIEFSHYPEDYFEYIMEEPFDIETDIGDYNVKATLTIPSGTSYSKDDKVTNTVGSVKGLAAIHPTITFKPSDQNITITEINTGQTFNMSYSGSWNDKKIIIDCDNRRVYLQEDENTRIDISKYVDHNSDWFRLYDEYSFEGLNCTILTVSYTERW